MSREGNLVEKCKRVFGVTKKPWRAAYINPDGSMLDFTLGEGDYRTYSHSDISKCIGNKFSPIAYYQLETGAARINMAQGGDTNISIYDVPTAAQLRTIAAALKQGTGNLRYDVFHRDHRICESGGGTLRRGGIAKMRETAEQCSRR